MPESLIIIDAATGRRKKLPQFPSIPDPANTDEGRQAAIVSVIQVLRNLGVIAPPATYTVSGAVSGSTLSGVTITLKRTGFTDRTTTTDGSGNYTFANVQAGTYTVEAAKAGHSFAPALATVVVVAGNMTQNFVASAASGSQGASLLRVLIPQNNAIRMRLLDTVARTLITPNPTDIASPTQNAYPPTFINGFWFVPFPNLNEVHVFDEQGVRKAILTGITSPRRILSEGGKYAVTTPSAIRFFTYNFTTHAWTLDAATITMTGGATIKDATSGAGRMFLGTTNAGGGNVRVIDVVAQTLATTFTVVGLSTVDAIEFGGNRVCCTSVGASTAWVVHDATTTLPTATTALTQTNNIGSPAVGKAGRMCFAQGRFFHTTNSGTGSLYHLNLTTSVATQIAVTLNFPTGCVTDGATVYVAEQSANQLRAFNATTQTQDGAAITGLNAPWFFID